MGEKEGRPTACEGAGMGAVKPATAKPAAEPAAGAAAVEAVGGASGAVPAKPALAKTARPERPASAFIRSENEDDDGYDPYSDRPAAPSPLFERDPWS